MGLVWVVPLAPYWNRLQIISLGTGKKNEKKKIHLCANPMLTFQDGKLCVIRIKFGRPSIKWT